MGPNFALDVRVYKVSTIDRTSDGGGGEVLFDGV